MCLNIGPSAKEKDPVRPQQEEAGQTDKKPAVKAQKPVAAKNSDGWGNPTFGYPRSAPGCEE